MNFQWYPGHMTKAKRAMQEDIKLINVVIELVDARIPLSSKNPDIDQLAKNKARIILLNKYDLADRNKTEEWKRWYEAKGYFAALVNAKSGAGVKAVHQVIQEACKEKIERDRRKGILNRPVRAMIVGIPNVGKSTFINSFAGKACTKTGNKPGVTKGKQWIRLNKNVELLDTPGILWPKFEDQTVGLHLALIGSIRDEILNKTELALELTKSLETSYPGKLAEFYQIALKENGEAVWKQDEKEAGVYLLEEIARKRGCIRKGSELDYEKAAALVLDDFKSGRIGAFTIELPQKEE